MASYAERERERELEGYKGGNLLSASICLRRLPRFLQSTSCPVSRLGIMSIKSMANILISKKENSLESFNYLDQVSLDKIGDLKLAMFSTRA